MLGSRSFGPSSLQSGGNAHCLGVCKTAVWQCVQLVAVRVWPRRRNGRPWPVNADQLVTDGQMTSRPAGDRNERPR